MTEWQEAREVGPGSSPGRVANVDSPAIWENVPLAPATQRSTASPQAGLSTLNGVDFGARSTCPFSE